MTLNNIQEYGVALFFYGGIAGILTQLVDRSASLQFNAVMILLAVGIIALGLYSIKNADKVISSLGGQ